MQVNPEQVGPGSHASTAAHTVERIMDDAGMTYISKVLRVKRLSLDVRNTHGLESDCKLSANSIV